MAKTEVILTTNIVGLGAESDQVKVASGYARNYLFPHKLAIPLTQANKRRLESLKQRRAEREAHEFNAMSELAKSVSKLICIVKVKTGEDGKLFGTVTTGMIADELKHQFDISLEKRKVHIEHSIRTLGEHEVELRLHPEVNATLKLRVESTTPLPEPTEAPAAEPRKDDRRGRKVEGQAQPESADKRSRGPRPERPAGKSDKPAKAEKPAKAVKGRSESE